LLPRLPATAGRPCRALAPVTSAPTSRHSGGQQRRAAMTQSPYTPEFFKTALGTCYASAQRIVPLALAIVPARSVLDVGCGTGHFLRAFREAGVSEITGIDGAHVPRDQLVIEAHHFVPADLSRGFDLKRRYDLLVSLEVAEHL